MRLGRQSRATPSLANVIGVCPATGVHPGIYGAFGGDRQAPPGVTQLRDGQEACCPWTGWLSETRVRRNFPVCSVAWAASGVPSMIG
jgi:hypothetical protein